MFFKPLIRGSILGALALSLLSSPSYAALTAEQRLADFEQLVATINRHYAPLRLKEKTIGLNFAKHVENFRARVRGAANDAEFYLQLSSFLAGLKDGHTNALIPSTYRSTLGFVTDYVDGKVFVDLIDRSVATKQLFPFHKGDRLLAINGVPVEQLIDELSKQASMGSALGTRRVNSFRLTNRIFSQGVEVLTGTAQVTILARGESSPVTIPMQWKVEGTPVVDLDDMRAMESELSPTTPTFASKPLSLTEELRRHVVFQGGSGASLTKSYMGAGIVEIGAMKSFFKLPDGAKSIPGAPFTAAVFEEAGKKIGVLRIPTFNTDPEPAIAAIGRAVMVLEQTSDVLVIDLTNNPGGNIALSSGLLSLFADKPMKEVEFQVRPSLKWQMSFDEMVDKVSNALRQNPGNAQAHLLGGRYRSLSGEVRQAMEQRRFLSKPFSLSVETSFGSIEPHDVATYSKPILLLVNELSVSAADMFAASLKDNGRATIFGGTTGGWGGNVAVHGPLANSYFRFTLTESLMVRPNGAYLENTGVQPDVAYSYTEGDFLNGYRGFVKAFTAEALRLAGAAPEQIEAFKQRK